MGYDLFIEVPDEATLAAAEALRVAAKTFAKSGAKGQPTFWDLPNPGYFRIGSFSMGRVQTWMMCLDMVVIDHVPADFPPFDGAKDEIETPEWLVAQDERQRRVDAILESRLAPECAGIPIQKLSSNDGWLVLPGEIEEALAAYDAAPRAVVEAVILTDELIDSTDPIEVAVLGRRGPRSLADKRADLVFWDDWIAFLRRAAQMGGFRVW
jgi:hypothetical protein